MKSLNLNNRKIIYPDNNCLNYMGRIDFSKKTAPIIIHAGSSITTKFSGTSIGIIINNHRFYNQMELGYLIDGKEGKISIPQNDKPILIEISEELENKTHEIIIFKRQDATHYFEFLGFVIGENDNVIASNPKLKRRIECFGDSVSAGAVCEAIQYVGKNDPDDTQGIYDNAWHSYSMITARNFGAELNNNSQGGIALFNGTGYYHAPNYIGLESSYDKLCYFPEGGITNWDFSSYIPHVVILAIGQNDNHKEGCCDNDIHEETYRIKWKESYKALIRDLRKKYQNASFILATTVLMHDADRDNAIEEIKNELCDEKIHHFMYKRNGSATPGHPRISEQCEMAEELTAFISNLGDDIWR